MKKAPQWGGMDEEPMAHETEEPDVENQFDHEAYAPEMDPRASYYSQEMTPRACRTFFTCAPTDSSSIAHMHVGDDIWREKVDRPIPSMGQRQEFPPPVLIDSGASGTAVGEKWAREWGKGANFALANSSRPFRCGDGVDRPSLGACVLPITIFPGHTNQTNAITLRAMADVVMADLPLLIPKKTLATMQGQLNYITSGLTIECNVTIQLSNLPSGHLSLHGNCKLMGEETATPSAPLNAEPTTSSELYHVMKEQGVTPTSDADINNVRLHLSHCGAHALGNLLRSGYRIVDHDQIKRVLGKCTCRGKVNRITPPKLAGWATKFGGEVIGVDAIYPFVDTAETREDIRGEINRRSSQWDACRALQSVLGSKTFARQPLLQH